MVPSGLAASRSLIAGLTSALQSILTIWYKRHEVMQRMAVFYAAASMSGAFSGLLAYAIQFMDGIGGRAGWQWIFMLKGLLPVSVSSSSTSSSPIAPRRRVSSASMKRSFSSTVLP